MLNIKFDNLKKIFGYINELKTRPVNYPSVFNSVKKMTLFFILYLFVTGITALIIIFSINKSQELVTVPKVVNMEFYKAYEKLSAKGFNVDIELKNLNNFDKGKVAYQSITEQKRVKKGRKIKLIVSLGQDSPGAAEKGEGSEINFHVVLFKLPETYKNARVKILITDEKDADKLLFDEIISQTNKLRLPVKIHGHGIQKIYINEELYIEKDID